MGTNRLENFELPSTTPGMDPGAIALLNDRFLRIAEKLKTSLSTTTGAVLIATHTERTAQSQFSAENLASGQQFWETDRHSVYVVRPIKNALTWAFEDGLYADVKSNRPADLALYDAGFLFFATDWEILWRWDGSVWRYLTGTYRAALASIPTLGTGDNGFRFEVTDYNHVLVWSGTAWGWGSGDGGGGYIQSFFADPNPTTGWQLCDGTTVAVLNPDGSTTNRTTPNLTGTPSYVKLGAAVSGPNAPVAPTINSHTTGITNANAATGVTVNSNTTGASLPVATGNDSGTPVQVDPGTTSFVAQHPHTHSEGNLIDPGHSHTITDPQHTHTVTDPGHIHTAGTNGEPENVVLRPWLRR